MAPRSLRPRPLRSSWWRGLAQLLRKALASGAGFLLHFLIPSFSEICQNERSEGRVVDQSLTTNSKFSLLAALTQIQNSGKSAPSCCRFRGRVFPRAGTVAARPATQGSAAPRSPKIPLPARRAQDARDAFASHDGSNALMPLGMAAAGSC